MISSEANSSKKRYWAATSVSDSERKFMLVVIIARQWIRKDSLATIIADPCRRAIRCWRARITIMHSSKRFNDWGWAWRACNEVQNRLTKQETKGIGLRLSTRGQDLFWPHTYLGCRLVNPLSLPVSSCAWILNIESLLQSVLWIIKLEVHSDPVSAVRWSYTWYGNCIANTTHNRNPWVENQPRYKCGKSTLSCS